MIIVDYFREYADVLFYHFGDQVKDWITVNEPNVFCGEGYVGLGCLRIDLLISIITGTDTE